MAKQKKKPAHEGGEPSPVDMGKEPPVEAQPSQLHVAAEDTPSPSAVSLHTAADAEPSEVAPAVTEAVLSGRPAGTEAEAVVLESSAAAQAREAEARDSASVGCSSQTAC